MQSIDADDRRKKIRVDFRTEIIIQAGTKEFHVTGSSKDLSVSGIFVKTEQSIPPHTGCRVKIVLSGMSEPLTLQIEGRVVRSNTTGVAISFRSMDLDSYTHLKNIVKYNVDNPDEVY